VSIVIGDSLDLRLNRCLKASKTASRREFQEQKQETSESRRPDSGRGPLHYEGKTSEGRASTRGHARAPFPWRADGFDGLAVDARARPRPS
jgi:hypothetical protein